MNQPTETNVLPQQGEPPLRRALREIFWIFFYTFPFLIILFPPDVFGDAFVALYFIALAMAGALFFRAAKKHGGHPRAPSIERVAAKLFRPWKRLLIFFLPAAMLISFIGLFVGMLFVLWRTRFFIALGVGAALWAAQIFAGKRNPRLKIVSLPRAYFALVWVSLVSFTVFSKSWAPEACDRIAEQRGVTPVFTQRQIEKTPALNGYFAYAAVPDAGGAAIFASFKPVSHQFGKVARIAVREKPGGIPSVRILNTGGEQGMIQGIAYDYARQLLFVPVSNKADQRLVVADCSGGKFDVIRTIRLPGEPGDIAVDSARSLLHIALKPNRIITYKLPEFRIVGDRNAPVLGGIDFIAVRPSDGRLYFTTVGFHVGWEDSSGKTARRFMLTSFGVDTSRGPRPRLFVASPGMEALYALDPDTLATEYKFKFGGGIRSVHADPVRNLVYAAAYASGILHIIDSGASSPREVAEIQLGKMLRRVTASPEGGRIFATSCCGIFEIDPEKLRAAK